ncbi:Na-translocating system protein MpsC family protein [Gorillibacterium sp. sgz500922]|uniref:Na-translocating system protein MpsC family protein n=1 Tax=Gorillibacterium sp. sgz500922 TaxID=3446694 RepID=UPI003F676333
MALSEGAAKQEILRIYNAINQKIFSAGVKQQRVDFLDNKILIMSRNSRVPILKLLDGDHPNDTRRIDQLLSQVFKREIRQALEQRFQLNIVAILKDYDAETEFSGTVVVLERDIGTYLTEAPELP